MSTTIRTWFDTTERRSLLMQVAKLWEKTPFFANSCAPGPDGGVDCVHLANAVYATCGCIDRVHIPPQIMDAAQHSTRSPLVEAFEEWPALKSRFSRLAHSDQSDPFHSSDIIPGDALLFRAGKAPHHCGIMLVGDEVLHCLCPQGVQRTHLRAVIRGRSLFGALEAVYRPTQ